MSATATTARLARTSTKFADRVRNASIASSPSSSHQHGQDIYIYSHLQTKQVIYSLQSNVKNSKALHQLPYNGKKTVPSALRKDLWTPLAHISFPSSPSGASAGLTAFRLLREYRVLHETSWPDSASLDDKGQPLSRRLRGRKLCDQRANSIADMAAALGKVTSGEEGGVTAKVEWKDVGDAEFAESWPSTVVHDRWEVGRNGRRSMREEEEEGVDGEIALDGTPVLGKE